MAAITERMSPACGWPTSASLAENVREARRAVTMARQAAEDAIDDATLKIRRHPITAVGAATCVGLVTGATLAATAAWFARPRT